MTEVYCISAQDAFLSTRLQNYINMHQQKPSFDELEWVQDFAKKTYGTKAKRFWEASEINEIIIELCAELFADRLQTIWLRAGGKTSDLVNHGTIYDQWVYAINTASQGKINKYPKSIVDILSHEFPRNDDVRNLIQLLN